MLREQVITPRARRGGAQKRGRAGVAAQQRPTARRGGAGRTTPARSSGSAWRKLGVWAPTIGKVLLAVCAGVFVFHLYSVASSSTFFALRTVDVSGASRASEEQIKTIVRRAAGPVGVWRTDIDDVRAELERQPWVRAAAVARVLPSGVRVRITERMPRAVVRTAAGRLMWVDDDGVIVGTVAPTDQMPAFFLRGWDEAETSAARAVNRRRVAKLLDLQNEWTTAGIAERVSEVNLDEPQDVRVQLAGADAQVEVRFLGANDLTKHLRHALEKLDESRATPRGSAISYIIARQDGGIVLGYSDAASQRAAVDDKTANGAVESPRTNNIKHLAKSNAAPRKAAHREARADAHVRGEAQRPRRVGKAD